MEGGCCFGQSRHSGANRLIRSWKPRSMPSAFWFWLPRCSRFPPSAWHECGASGDRMRPRLNRLSTPESTPPPPTREHRTRTSRSGRSERFTSSGVKSDPTLAVLVELLLPDRRLGLQLLDRELAGAESGGAVRRGGCDHHRQFAGEKSADPVHDRQTCAGPSAGKHRPPFLRRVVARPDIGPAFYASHPPPHPL